MNSELDTNYRPLTWEYIAGFFDGEGCIFFLDKKRLNTKRYVIMHITQGIINNQCHIMERIGEFLQHSGIKARINLVKPRPQCGSKGGIKVVVSSAMSCKDWLEAMLPYLTVKRKKAIEAIEFITSEFEQPWMTPRQELEILELRKNGYGIKRIGKKMGIGHSTAKRVLKRNNAYNERFKPTGRPRKK